MKFVRQRIVAPGGLGVPPTILVSAETDPVWGNGGVGTGTKALPAAYSTDSTFEHDINGCDQIFVGVNIVVLGGGGLTGITLAIEFQDTSDPSVWYPSHEPAKSAAGGVEAPLRTDALALQEWVVAVGVGNYIVASRKEHKQFRKFRVRFRRTAGAPDATTRINCYWWHSGGHAEVAEQ